MTLTHTFRRCLLALPLGLLTAAPVAAQHALSFTADDNDQVLVAMAAPTGAFTLEAWVKYTDPTYAGSHNTIIEFDNDDPYFGILSTGELELYLQQNSPAPVATLSWHHVACTYDPATTTTRLYIDGMPAGVNQSSTLSVPSTTTMGIGFNAGDTGWQGEIDEVMVWSTVRTQAQIQADRWGYPAALPGMLAYFKFDEGSGQTVNNLVPGAPDGVLGLTTSQETADPGWTNSNVVAAPAELPTPALALSAAPNPASGPATLTFTLAKPGQVTLTVSDCLGREVATLVAEMRAAGTHTLPFPGTGLPAGMYTCRLATTHQSVTQRLVLTR